MTEDHHLQQTAHFSKGLGYSNLCQLALYHQTSSSHTKSQHLNVSHLILQLSLPNPLKPGVISQEWRCSWSNADRPFSCLLMQLILEVWGYAKLCYQAFLLTPALLLILKQCAMYMVLPALLSVTVFLFGTLSCTQPEYSNDSREMQIKSNSCIFLITKSVKACDILTCATMHFYSHLYLYWFPGICADLS